MRACARAEKARRRSASHLKKHENATEMTDIMFFSIFLEKAIKKGKNRIFDSIL